MNLLSGRARDSHGWEPTTCTATQFEGGALASGSFALVFSWMRHCEVNTCLGVNKTYLNC